MALKAGSCGIDIHSSKSIQDFAARCVMLDKPFPVKEYTELIMEEAFNEATTAEDGIYRQINNAYNMMNDNGVCCSRLELKLQDLGGMDTDIEKVVRRNVKDGKLANLSYDSIVEQAELKRSKVEDDPNKFLCGFYRFKVLAKFRIGSLSAEVTAHDLRGLHNELYTMAIVVRLLSRVIGRHANNLAYLNEDFGDQTWREWGYDTILGEYNMFAGRNNGYRGIEEIMLGSLEDSSAYEVVSYALDNLYRSEMDSVITIWTYKSIGGYVKFDKVKGSLSKTYKMAHDRILELDSKYVIDPETRVVTLR